MTTPSMIPGVVDGTVTASTEVDGTVSLRITIGDRTGHGDYVELIIAGEHAGRIAATLLSPADTAAPTTAPCSVGVRLTTGTTRALWR